MFTFYLCLSLILDGQLLSGERSVDVILICPYQSVMIAADRLKLGSHCANVLCMSVEVIGRCLGVRGLADDECV